ERPNDLNGSLLTLLHALSGAADFQDTLQILAEGAGGLLPCDGTAVMWLAGDHLEVLASYGPTAPLRGLTLPVAQIGAAQAALDAARPVLLDAGDGDPDWQQVPGEEAARCWLGAPLMTGDWSLGLLEWTASETGRFGPAEVALARQVSEYVSPVLHRAQLLEDARQRLRDAVQPAPAPVSQSTDPGTKLQPLVREALDLTAARHAFLFLQEEGGPALRCVAASGERREYLMKVSLRGDGSLGSWRVEGDRQADWLGTGPSDREVLAELGIQRTLILPLRVGGRQVGMLGVAGPQRNGSFGRDAIRLMTHLASQASVIVEQLSASYLGRDLCDYELIFQSSPLGIAVLTVTGEIQANNSALSGLLSRSDRSLAGHRLSEFLVRADGQRLLRALEEVAITGQRRQVDARAALMQGDHRHVRISLSLARIAGRADGSLVAVMEDVTPLKILEQERVDHLRQLREKHSQLQELDQVKSRFVSNVSHELRTPLAVIKLYATLARKGRPEKQSHYLQTIEQETHRLETMVENILDLTRMDRQSLRVNPERLAAEEVIGQVLQVYEESAQKRGIELRNHARGPLPPLWADKNHLIQMLTNLVDNAIKYTPRGGQVWVAAREEGMDSSRWLEIAVGDTGAGIAEDEQDNVFERFYRGSNNTPGSTGTGLGLAIVQELMGQHGGRVTLRSRLGEGSVFALHFPLFDEEELEAGQEEDRASSQ
ncbi:MAG: ATP-binding protein, partial [Anaerolineae bacterium]